MAQGAPRGTAEELLAAIGEEFPHGYFPVLRAQLAVLQDAACPSAEPAVTND